MKPKPKAKIHQNIWGNWRGYHGTKCVIEFGIDYMEAVSWINDQIASDKFRGETYVVKEGTAWPTRLL